MRARTLEKKVSFNTEKRQALKTAKELCYKKNIIDLIQNATTSTEISRALQLGRLG